MMKIAVRTLALVAVAGVSVAGCGGGDDAASTTVITTVPVVTPAPVVTSPPTTTGVSYVTEGATVVVANGSRVDGAASRMSKQLSEKGYKMAEPTNTGGTLKDIEFTKIFFVSGDANAQAVAQSIKGALGGTNIDVTEMPTPAPTASGALNEGETVVVAIGNDVADKTLDQLQGKTPATTGDAETEGETDGTGESGTSSTPSTTAAAGATDSTTPT